MQKWFNIQCNSTIDRPNKVWAMDLTYIPMARGFVYLVAVMDWYTRKVLSWRDYVFIERLWRSVKYEEVYLHAYDTVSDSRAGIGRYFDLYNLRRPHSSLGRRTPDDVYFSQQSLTLAASMMGWNPLIELGLVVQTSGDTSYTARGRVVGGELTVQF